MKYFFHHALCGLCKEIVQTVMSSKYYLHPQKGFIGKPITWSNFILVSLKSILGLSRSMQKYSKSLLAAFTQNFKNGMDFYKRDLIPRVLVVEILQLQCLGGSELDYKQLIEEGF